MLYSKLYSFYAILRCLQGILCVCRFIGFLMRFLALYRRLQGTARF